MQAAAASNTALGSRIETLEKELKAANQQRVTAVQELETLIKQRLELQS